MVNLQVVAVFFGRFHAGAYTALLKEKNGYRKIPVTVGTAAAHFIVLILSGLKPPRPMIYDLFYSLTKVLNVVLQQVNIHKYMDGLFYSELIFNKKEGEETLVFRFEVSISDSIALALRFRVPIFATEKIVEKASVPLLDGEEIESESVAIENSSLEKTPQSFESMNINDLQIRLEESVIQEDYEKAAYFRDIIQTRQNK